MREAARRADDVFEVAREELLLLDLGSRRSMDAALACVQVLARSSHPLDLACLVPLVFAESWSFRSKPEALGAVAAASADAVLAMLARLPPEACLAIDAAMRRPGYRLLGWKYFQEWAGFGPSEALAGLEARGVLTTPLLGILSTHPSGYVRERAVRELDRLGPSSLRWLLVRTNDWVDPVRRLATEAALRSFVPERANEVVGCLPLLDRLRPQSRTDDEALRAAVLELFARDDAPLRERGLGSRRVAVRRSAYRMAAACSGRARRTPYRTAPEGRGPDVALLARALRDRDLPIRVWAARLAKTLGAPERARLAPFLLETRTGAVRRVGYELASEADLPGVDDILLRGIDDASASSRHLCRFLLRERGHDEDFAARYRGAVARGHAAVGALRGLGELGRAEDWELFVPYVDEGGRRGRAAVAAMAKLDRAASHELRMFLVGSPEPGVSAEAARTLAGSIGAEDAGALEEHLEAAHPHVRRHAVRLAAYLPGWSAPIAMLSHDRAADRDTRDAALGCWLGRAWKRVGPASPIEHEKMRALLDEAELDASAREAIAKLLEFVTAAR